VTHRLKLAGQGLALAAVFGLLALLVWRITHEPTPVKRGGAAPVFSAPRLEGGGGVSLASLRGKAVVVNFWASWCAPCKSEAPALEQAWQQYRDKGLVVLGVDYNDASSDARRFVRRAGLTFPIVRDHNGMLGDRYDLTGVPETFIVDRRGRLVDHLLAPVDKGANVEAFQRALALALKP
jgi:cytochrome c biogenesis protein CcmG/thiol:disulfide interchange protein DsbE